MKGPRPSGRPACMLGCLLRACSLSRWEALSPGRKACAAQGVMEQLLSPEPLFQISNQDPEPECVLPLPAGLGGDREATEHRGSPGGKSGRLRLQGAELSQEGNLSESVDAKDRGAPGPSLKLFLALGLLHGVKELFSFACSCPLIFSNTIEQRAVSPPKLPSTRQAPEPSSPRGGAA